ncbi:hypothetical protein KAZ92_01925 [Candidatus Gracilibacteria bacterium]|nr:hypothetical protein [Candidatus Gracilibacteria bacterium]
MSAPSPAPAEAPKAAEAAAHATPKPDAAIAKPADATHAAVAEAAKPAKPAKEVLVEFQAAHDAPGRKAIIEKLHLSPEEAKDAALQKSFKDAAHGDHDIEAAIDKKFTEAAHAKPAEAAHATPDAAHGATAEKPKAAADHAAEKPHDDAPHDAAAGHKEDHAAAPAATPVVPPAAAHPAAHGEDDSPGLIKRFVKNTFWELPKSLVQPPKLGLQVGGEILKGGWAMLRGLFSKKYREETYSNPPVELKAGPKAANDDKEHDAHAHAA